MLHIDFETRSTVDLKKVGVYRYAEDPSTEVMCMAYAFGNDPVQIWDARDEVFPWEVFAYMQGGGIVHAWNAAFEREITRTVLARRFGDWPPLDVQWRCTMAQALAMGLPGKLERCAPVILGRHGPQKDMAGNRLTMQLARPRSRDPLTWWEDDDKWQRMLAYCMQDVEVERAIGKKLRPLSDYEQGIWELDQQINDRGVALDVPLIHAGIALTQEAHRRASVELSTLTNGYVTAATQNDKLAQWLGVPSVDKNAVAGLLASDTLTDTQRRVLTIRQDTGMSSLAKLPGMLAAMCKDGRVRGLIQYHAAHTGRWGGRLIQPQNFPRGTVKKAYALLAVLRDHGAAAYDTLAHVAPPLHVLVSVLRACLVPEPGKRFAAWDYSAIEPRVLAWLAGQEDALERYRQKFDEYKAMAAFMFGVAYADVTPFQRQLAKATVLGCGFGMGKARFKVAASLAPYFLEIDEAMAETAVNSYRERWHCVPEFWKAAEQAVIRAIQCHNTPQVVNDKITVIANAAWLLVKLPSGRLLTYPQPSVRPTLMPWKDKYTGEDVYRDAAFAWGENGMTKKWEEYSLWGGFLTENWVQAIARDLLAEAMRVGASEGILPVLTSHDEQVAEIIHADQAERMQTIMETVPAWAHGLPVAVEGWVGDAYRK